MTGDRPGPCRDDVCITCGDVAVPVRVVRLLPGGLAVVEVDGGREEEVSVALVSATVGAHLLVHAGEAIAALDDALYPTVSDKARRVATELDVAAGMDGGPSPAGSAAP